MRGAFFGLTIGPDWLAIRWTDAKDGGDQDVLERRDKEKGGIFVIESLECLVVDIWLGVPDGARKESAFFCLKDAYDLRHSPRLPSNPNKDQNLNERIDDRLTDDAGEDLFRNKTGGGSLGVNFGVWESAAH